MTAAPSERWIPSSRRNPCPVCGRVQDGDCRTSGDGARVICHKLKDHQPGDVVVGPDGTAWAFTDNTSDGRGGHFKIDQPLGPNGRPPLRVVQPRRGPQQRSQAAPPPITGPITLATTAGLPEATLQELQANAARWDDQQRPRVIESVYGPGQVVRRQDKANGEKVCIPRHNGKPGAGTEPWDLYGKQLAMQAAGSDLLEGEGEKVADLALAAGLVAISQPGHDHKAASIERRYRELAAAKKRVIYLADHDETGRAKADKCRAAAAAAQLPFLVMHAIDVWPDLPKGGSIDDAPGTLPERAAAIVAAVERAQEQQAATTQPQAQPADAAPYRVLGWCQDRTRIYYQHRQTGQIAYLRPTATPSPFLHLADLSHWEEGFPGKSGGANWAAVCSHVIEQADHAGVFAPDRVRGRGVWRDGNRTVWHLGDRLEVDGQEVPLIEHISAHHYPRLPRLDINPDCQPLSDTEGAQILQAVAAMGWSTPLDSIHLLGWVVVANVGGAVEKRPVLQATSGTGTGKTYTKERVVSPLLGGLAISSSNSTEAGIRQRLRADTLPVLIDESEGEDPHRREGHLRLARLSFDGSPTERGTTHGQSLSYAVRSSVALVGINATIANPADRNRTVVVGRERLPQATWAPVDRRLQELLTPETGARLIRRAVSNLPTLLANVITFRRVVEGSGAVARTADTYGALLAGAHLLTSTELLTDDAAVAWLASVGWSAAAALGDEGLEAQDGAAESLQCLQHLLSHEEPWRQDEGTGRLSIRELVTLARSPSGADEAEQARTALGRRGIRAMDVGLTIANNPEALAPIYGNTKWRNGGHRARLLELPGAFAAGMVRFQVLGLARACKVPWEAIG